MPDNLYDITIIGGGPVGLFTSFYAGLRRARTKIIESLDELGGQPHHLFGEKFIYDIPAYPRILGRQLTHSLKEQADRFKPTIVTGEKAIDIQFIENKQDKYFAIKTEKQTHYSKTIIIAAGNGAFSPRKLQIDNAEEIEGKFLHYFVNDLNRFENKNVVVCGGGDSAVDWALSLEPIANQVTLIHRRSQFRAHESSLFSLRNSSVIVKTPYIPASFNISNHKLISMTINKPRTEEFETIEADDVIVSYGFTSSFGEINHWGLDIKRNAIQVNPTTMETNIPGVFAVGDIAGYNEKIKLIATGFGEAPQAVASALKFINPNEQLTMVHSSHLLEGE